MLSRNGIKDIWSPYFGIFRRRSAIKSTTALILFDAARRRKEVIFKT